MPLTKNSYCQQVIELIKVRIKQGELRPGDRINEVALAKECGVSRAPIREALFSLEASGFLSSDSKRGKYVTKVNAESIINGYELCGLLEGQALFTSVKKFTEMDWQRAENILEELKLNSEISNELDKKADLATELHNSLLLKADNILLVNTSKKFGHIISKYLMYKEWQSIYTAKEMYLRHLELFEATKSLDELKIRSATLSHFADSASRLVKKI